MLMKEPELFVYTVETHRGKSVRYLTEKIKEKGHFAEYTDIAYDLPEPGPVLSTYMPIPCRLARVRARDLVLYLHWPIKTKRFFELLESS